jgi:ornithine cyclodeaminase/alanine dehydrogenase-like protein (mu-crystallin family)
MPILLTDDDVRDLLTMGEAVEVVELALREFQLGKAENAPRNHFYASSGAGTFFMRNFHGAVPALGVAGLRVTTDLLGGGASPRPDQRPFGAFLLFALKSAALLAVIHDHELQRIRVGAESGVALRHLARADAGNAAVLGAGFQAETQLAAACAVRPIQSVSVYSPTAQRRSAFAARMSDRLSIEVTAAGSAQEAVTGKAIVLAATNASSPVLDGSWLSPGAHVTSIVNSDRRFPRRELDDATFARASLVAIGYLEQTERDRAADIFEAIESGSLDRRRICQLGEILVGSRAGRVTQDDITVFKNNGLAVEFVALAARVYDLAQSRGRGEEIPERYFSQRRQ